MKVGGEGAFGVCDFGTGRRTIGIFPHLDVVPALEGWRCDPFNPAIEGEYIIGRGVSDDKAGAIMAIYALDILKRINHIPSCTIRLVLGCNEEKGMQDIVLFKKEYPLPDFSLVPDAFFPAGIGEKGRVSLRVVMDKGFRQIKMLRGGALNGSSVPERAECILEDTGDIWSQLEKLREDDADIRIKHAESGIWIEARGIGAHPAMPQDSVNAIEKLLSILVQIKGLQDEEAMLLQNIENMVKGYDGSGLGIAYADGVSSPLTSVCIGAETDGDGCLSMQFNIRFCVTMKEEKLKAILKERVPELGGHIEILESSPSHYVSDESGYVKAANRAYSLVAGEPAVSYVHPGGTYAGKLGNAIIFGNEFRKEIPFPKGTGRAHQVDEAVSINDIIKGIKYTYMLCSSLKRR